MTWTGVDSDATVDLSRVYLLKLPHLEDVDAAGAHARIGLHAAGAEKHASSSSSKAAVKQQLSISKAAVKQQ